MSAASNTPPATTDSAERRPSLLSLPPEVLRFIIPDPFAVAAVSVSQRIRYGPRWLAIAKKGSHPGYAGAGIVDEPIEILRLLSQVCRSLRNLTLPKLWTVVQVATVEELGRLRETLRVSPHLAQLIRRFDFSWGMDGDTMYCNFFPDQEGKMLELAFRDRFRVWDRFRERLQCEAEWQESGSHFRLLFQHGNLRFLAPGVGMTSEPEYDEEDDATYAAHRGNGPDGDGEDRLVRSASDFTACVGEIVAQLKWLETFVWSTDVTSMPLGVFRSLAKLTTLRSLGYPFTYQRLDVCAVPLWELAGGLQELLLTHPSVYTEEQPWCEEQAEERLTAYELPITPSNDFDLNRQQNPSIARRTTIAAARSGRLSRLMIGGELEEPFAIRSLLPCWVRIRDWDRMFEKQWSSAALSLRPLLAHASLWHVANKERLLTRQDVQDLQRRFEATGVPKVAKLRRANPSRALAHYLAWLREDAELAQQVADVWNEVVSGGGANVVQCQCTDCKQ